MMPVDWPVQMVEAISEVTGGEIDPVAFIQDLRAKGYRILPADLHDACPTCDSVDKTTVHCLVCDIPHPTPHTEPSACTNPWHH